MSKRIRKGTKREVVARLYNRLFDVDDALVFDESVAFHHRYIVRGAAAGPRVEAQSLWQLADTLEQMLYWFKKQDVYDALERSSA